MSTALTQYMVRSVLTNSLVGSILSSLPLYMGSDVALNVAGMAVPLSVKGLAVQALFVNQFLFAKECQGPSAMRLFDKSTLTNQQCSFQLRLSKM